MTRKHLPKAIRNEATRVGATGGATDEEAPARQSALPDAMIKTEPTLAISALPVANDQLSTASIRVQSLAARRRSLAQKIVERHRMYAAMGGLFPLPIVNVAGVTAIILRMVKQLSELYQVPFERDRTRSIVIGLMGGAGSTGLGTATASTIAFVAPGGAFAGLVVSAFSAAAFTRGIGLVLVEHFENGA